MANSSAKERRLKRKARRAYRRGKRTSLVDSLAAAGARMSAVGATLFTVLRVATATVLVVATATAAASLVSRPVQQRITRQIAGRIRGAALTARAFARQI
jgi:hypothetical protein